MAHTHISVPSGTPIKASSTPITEPLYGAAADQVRDQLREPSDLAVAIDLAERMLDSDHIVGVREALRILIRAAEQDAVRRSVDAQFPAVAAFLATERGEQQ